MGGLYEGGGKNVPKRWGILPDSGSGGIHLSLVVVDSHFIDWGTTQGWLSLFAADVLLNVVKQSDDDGHCWMIVDLLSCCSRFSNSVVGACAAGPLTLRTISLCLASHCCIDDIQADWYVFTMLTSYVSAQHPSIVYATDTHSTSCWLWLDDWDVHCKTSRTGRAEQNVHSTLRTNQDLVVITYVVLW